MIPTGRLWVLLCMLAVPMMAAIKSVADHVAPLKPVSRLLAP